MGTRHFGHSHHHHSPAHHSHHAHYRHDPFWDHQHAALKLFVFGTSGKDGLDGTGRSEAIIGFRGNDEIHGNGGNDWISGGRGADTLDGGAGNDKVFGGKGDDVIVHSLAENFANEGCGRGDFYDGGKGHDILHLVLTAEEWADQGVQADIKAFEAFLAESANDCGSRGKVFEFASFDLSVRNFEELKIEVGDVPTNTLPNTPPVAAADPDSGTIQTLEDASVDIDVLANDSDPDGDPLNVGVVVQPAHGIVEFNADGTLKYTPEEDYFGFDSFSYQASDGTDLSQAVGVDIEVLPVNDKPESKDHPDDKFVWMANKGAMVLIDVLGQYAPGPDNESGQTVSLLGANFATGSGFGMLFGINAESKIAYVAPNGIPAGKHEIIEFQIADDLGAMTVGSVEIALI